MIGDRYVSTGITCRWLAHRDAWAASLKFIDAGWTPCTGRAGITGFSQEARSFRAGRYPVHVTGRVPDRVLADYATAHAADGPDGSP